MPCYYCCCLHHNLVNCDSAILLSAWKDTIYRVVHAADPYRLMEEDQFDLARNALRFIETGVLRSISTRFCNGMVVFERDVAIRSIIQSISANYSYWEETGYLPESLENRIWQPHPLFVGEIYTIPNQLIEIQEAKKDMEQMSIGEFTAELVRLGMDDACADLKKYIAEAERVRKEHSNPVADCPICFEEKKIKLMCSTNCHHMFCKVCIAKHFNKNSDKCPMCREQIKMLRNIV